MKINCDWCNKEVYKRPCRVKNFKQHFCSRDCAGKWRSVYQRGEKSPNWKGGMIPYNCKYCNKIFEDLPTTDRKFCSMSCYNRFGKNAKGRIWSIQSRLKSSKSHLGIKNGMYGRSGEKNPAWKDGVSKKSLRDSIRRALREWRNIVFRRDDWTCQICHIRGTIINAHHIKAFKDYPDFRTIVDNGITLCINCHKWVHRINVVSQQ